MIEKRARFLKFSDITHDLHTIGEGRALSGMHDFQKFKILRNVLYSFLNIQLLRETSRI